MAWYKTGTISISGATATGTGTNWTDNKMGIGPGQALLIPGAGTVKMYEILRVDSATKITLTSDAGMVVAGSSYAIMSFYTDSVPDFARRLAAQLSYYQSQMDGWQQIMTGAGTINIEAPDGTIVAISSFKKLTDDMEGKATKEELSSKASLDAANTFNGTQAINGGLFVAATSGNTGFELGRTDAASASFIDFHSSGNAIDFDSRIYATGGSSTAGNGALSIQASAVSLGSVRVLDRIGEATAGSGVLRDIVAGSDGASYDTICNLNLASWYGIGFCTTYTSPSNGVVTGKPAVFINTRNGNLYARNAVYANSTQLTSDRRAKDDIEPITGGLAIIEQLNPCTFKYRNTGLPSAGLIAQEVQEVLPDLVSENEDVDILTLDYNGVLGYLISAVKELKAKVDELEEQRRQE